MYAEWRGHARGCMEQPSLYSTLLAAAAVTAGTEGPGSWCWAGRKKAKGPGDTPGNQEPCFCICWWGREDTGKSVPGDCEAHETGNGKETWAGHLAASKGNLLRIPGGQERAPGPQMLLPLPPAASHARTQPWTSTDPMEGSVSGLEVPSWLAGTQVEGGFLSATSTQSVTELLMTHQCPRHELLNQWHADT